VGWLELEVGIQEEQVGLCAPIEITIQRNCTYEIMYRALILTPAFGMGLH